ncbi:MAG: carbamoyltransferase [Blastocatellia bacterium]|nr:carbamoyltransferase [Blastocatellia bacterium]
MNILGINAYHGDASAALVVDGQLVAAVEEERFNRFKHWAGFPLESVRYCLEAANLRLEDIDHVAVSRNPSAHIHQKILFALSKRPSLGLVKDRLANAGKVSNALSELAGGFQLAPEKLKAVEHHVEHHLAHLASSFFVSPFEEAACLSIDGFGDFLSTLWGTGKNNTLKTLGNVTFPHSLGIFYTAVTQYLGFLKYGDEYKVMGLAPYGQPEYLNEFRKIVKTGAKGFKLDLSYFRHHTDGVAMTWDGGEPSIGQVFSEQFVKKFGPARQPGEPLEDKHRNLAASLQAMCEEVYFHLLNQLYDATKLRTLCLAGGVAYNSVANGKIFDNTPFQDIYIQSAAGDAGTALGAAFYVWNAKLKQPRGFVMRHSYWGPEYSQAQFSEGVEARRADLEQVATIRHLDSEEAVCEVTAQSLADGNVVGWFQGRMEWGPRALGNRSILTDPRRAEMKDVLNARIKRREPFRPFCPTILSDFVGEYFEKTYPEPFMIKVYVIKPEKRSVIPAVTHVDGTGRLQTVSEAENPLYTKLIRSFHKLTGVPVVLNTSFNENEPVVCKPAEAIDCFLRTRMDVLVLGNLFIEKKPEAKLRETNA